MTSIKRQAIVNYTTAEMYDLVNAIEDYAKFLTWCRSSVVHLRTAEEVRATLCFATGGLQKCFTTCDRLHKNKMIEVRLIDGPFKHLEGYWRFDTIDEHRSKVCLDMTFEFSNRILGYALGPFFNQIANSLVDAFCKRAIEIYGVR